jgi:ubiquitin-conjugating enzyme E2 D/E
MDILTSDWNASLTAEKAVMYIEELLKDPNNEDPYEPEISRQYLRDRPAFDNQAKEWTIKYAY